MQNGNNRSGASRERAASSATRGTHSKRTIFRRTVFMMVVCGVVMFIPMFWKLWDIAIVHHDEYQKRASDQQTLDLTVPASRGNIYDRNGNVMAMSATVYNLILSPNDLVKSVPTKDEDGNQISDELHEAAVAAKQEQVKKDIMALLPDLDEEKLDTQIHATKYSYREIKTNIEEEDAEAIREYIVENETASYLYLMTGTKRYYPYSGLAAQTLGFVNAEGGAYGIEAKYNDLLEGTAGRVVTTKTASGVEMFNTYSEYIDAQDGYDVTLTIDATIQSYLEKALEEGIKSYDVQNGGFGIAMNPQTGEVLGIASSPDFDPNNYSQVTDEILNQHIAANAETIYQELKANNTENLTDEELRAKAEGQAYNQAMMSQWNSRVINDAYEPGSTFKAIVLSMALEEGLVNENDTFTCTGGSKIPGYPKVIHCSKRDGHGVQTLAEAVQNSCNPAFMEIGQRLGVERFYKYFQEFGYTEMTGIDLPSEVVGQNWGDAMSNVDLAVASFGQRFTTTPIQHIAAFSAVINGGKLMQPYVVKSVTDQDGNVIQNTEPTLVRQVVSQETSRRATEILESVVGAPKGSGRFAYQAGYRIGGKTGTSEVGTDRSRFIVSFIGFAPADNPQLIILLAFDKPQQSYPGSNWCTTGVYISGGNMAAPIAGPMMADMLDYLGVEKKYTAEEAAAIDVSTPRVIGQSVAEAKQALDKKNLDYRTIGEGETVTAQVPAAGASVPGGSTVILYLGDAVPEETGTVPDVTGMSYEAAKKTLEKAGFFMRASGASVYYSNTTTVASQSIAGGETAAVGTVVDAVFRDVIEDGAVGLE